MTEQNWELVQGSLESLNESVSMIEEHLTEIKSFRLGKRVLELVSAIESECENVKTYSDAVYNDCESDYCDEESMPSGYDEVLDLLPDGDKLSVAEMQSLIEHINQWKTEYGYSTTNC